MGRKGLTSTKLTEKISRKHEMACSVSKNSNRLFAKSETTPAEFKRFYGMGLNLLSQKYQKYKWFIMPR